MKSFSIPAISLAVLLTACGGSDTKTNGTENENSRTFSALAITSENAIDVSTSVYSSGKKGLENLAVSKYLSEFTFINIPGLSSEAYYNRIDVNKTAMDFQLNKKALLDEPFTEPCETGSVIVDILASTDEDNFVQGDNISAGFNNCVVGELTTNGQFDIIFETFELELNRIALSVEVVFTDFTVASGNSLERIEGDMKTSLVLEDFAITIENSAERFIIESANKSVLLENFIATTEINPASNITHFSLSGTVHDSMLEGALIFDTLVPFAATIGQLPTEGMLIITGADNASISMEVNDSGSIDLEVDLDGDGEVDDFLNIDWEELISDFPDVK